MQHFEVALVLSVILTTVLSCDQLAPADDADHHEIRAQEDTRSAFDITHAEKFDYNHGCTVFHMCGNQQDVDCVFLGNTYDGGATAYYNMNFGTGAAAVKFSVACDNTITVGTSRIDLRLDSINATAVGSVVVGFTGGGFHWITIETFLDYPILGGVHDLYLTYVRDCETFDCGDKCGVANIDWFQFYPMAV